MVPCASFTNLSENFFKDLYLIGFSQILCKKISQYQAAKIQTNYFYACQFITVPLTC